MVSNLQLNNDKLYELVDRIRLDIVKANRLDQLETFFQECNFNKYLGTTKDRLPYINRSTILIIGASQLNEDQIRKLAKDHKIDPKRIECVLDYSKLTSYTFKKLENNTSYRCLLIGPMPHSLPGKEEYESIISKMENEIDKYPEVFLVKTESDQLKITKSAIAKIFKVIASNH